MFRHTIALSEPVKAVTIFIVYITRKNRMTYKVLNRKSCKHNKPRQLLLIYTTFNFQSRQHDLCTG